MHFVKAYTYVVLNKMIGIFKKIAQLRKHYFKKSLIFPISSM